MLEKIRVYDEVEFVETPAFGSGLKIRFSEGASYDRSLITPPLVEDSYGNYYTPRGVQQMSLEWPPAVLFYDFVEVGAILPDNSVYLELGGYRIHRLERNATENLNAQLTAHELEPAFV